MAVDQAGHRQLPASLYALPYPGSRIRQLAGGNGLDDAVAHDDRRILDERDAFLVVVDQGSAARDGEIGGRVGHCTTLPPAVSHHAFELAAKLLARPALPADRHDAAVMTLRSSANALPSGRRDPQLLQNRDPSGFAVAQIGHTFGMTAA
jgi:hypothetical protein